jgi:hypothetical protein
MSNRLQSRIWNLPFISGCIQNCPTRRGRIGPVVAVGSRRRFRSAPGDQVRISCGLALNSRRRRIPNRLLLNCTFFRRSTFFSIRRGFTVRIIGVMNHRWWRVLPFNRFSVITYEDRGCKNVDKRTPLAPYRR